MIEVVKISPVFIISKNMVMKKCMNFISMKQRLKGKESF